MNGVLADLGRAVLGVRVYGIAAISFAGILSGAFVDLCPLSATMGIMPLQYFRKVWAIRC